MNNQIYMIFYDRGNRAQDNGEHFCRWVMRNHPEVKTAYILNSDSPDWLRLKKEKFNLLDLKDRANVHNELMKCNYACSSIFNEGINLNFNNCTCKRVFLNHGCFLVPIKYIKDEHNNVDLFIADNNIEYNNLLDPYHQLTSEQVALCGQPRHDNLVKLQQKPHKEDTILIQFWQRPWEWCENNNKKFLTSSFYAKTIALLSNPKLLQYCRKNKLKIVFKMHSIQYNWLKYYKKYQNDVVWLSPLAEPFEPFFIKSKLMITDISSNAYEMAKINKPCIYFEPDPEVLFKWRLNRNGGFEFDLENKSIGPVINYSVDKVVDEICNLLDNNCVLDDMYLKRRNEQISFLNDTQNCERCFKAILNIKTCKVVDMNKRKEYESEIKKEKNKSLTASALPRLDECLFW